jgi:hypothetical protein
MATSSCQILTRCVLGLLSGAGCLHILNRWSCVDEDCRAKENSTSTMCGQHHPSQYVIPGGSSGFYTRDSYPFDMGFSVVLVSVISTL